MRKIRYFLHLLKWQWKYNIKQPLWCSIFHKEHRCYPRVDLPGPESLEHWHCSKCAPCGEDVWEYLEFADIWGKK